MNQGILPLLEKSNESVKLPLLPKNLHLLMKALADDEITYQKLAEVIMNYPEITARLMFLANSAWSAPVAPITNIEQACTRLGTTVVRSVSIALSVSAHFNPARCPDFDSVRFWTTSMLVAEGAGLLTAGMQKDKQLSELQKTAQTAGVLHNLGLLWLAENLPMETGNALRMAALEPAMTVSEALHQRIGVDYCMVGGWIARQWKLPEILGAAMRYHLDGNYEDEFWEMTLLVGSAAAMVAAVHNESVDAPHVNPKLNEELGIAPSAQGLVLQALFTKLDKTRELAKILFFK
jgi:HD-like signal output (HDOD) protein